MAASRPVVLITGPTASGKSALALALAETLGGEILSVDSTAVYVGLDVGSAKPSTEDRRRVPHHLLDLADPYETYQMKRFLTDARTALAQVDRACRLPFLVGGTSMYQTALVEGWSLPGEAPDPEARGVLGRRIETEGARTLHRELVALAPDAAARLSPNDGVRIMRALERAHAGKDSPLGKDPSLSLLGRVKAYVLDVPPDVTRERIALRTDDAFLSGLLEETRRLLARGVTADTPSLRSVGYREAVWYVHGRLTRDEFRRLVIRHTARLAKKQRTWWRRIPWAVHVSAEEARTRILRDLGEASCGETDGPRRGTGAASRSDTLGSRPHHRRDQDADLHADGRQRGHEPMA